MRNALFVLLLLAVGCELPKETFTSENVAEVAVTLGKVISQENVAPVDVVPDDKSDKCENCNGTGKVGDGRVFVPCIPCDGTGKKKVAAEPVAEVEQVKPTITIYKSETCLPCKKWMEVEAPKYKKVGWEIKEVVTEDGPWPRFHVCDAKTCFNHTGYLTVKAFTAGINGK